MTLMRERYKPPLLNYNFDTTEKIDAELKQLRQQEARDNRQMARNIAISVGELALPAFIAVEGALHGFPALSGAGFGIEFLDGIDVKGRVGEIRHYFGDRREVREEALALRSLRNEVRQNEATFASGKRIAEALQAQLAANEKKIAEKVASSVVPRAQPKSPETRTDLMAARAQFDGIRKTLEENETRLSRTEPLLYGFMSKALEGAATLMSNSAQENTAGGNGTNQSSDIAAIVDAIRSEVDALAGGDKRDIRHRKSVLAEVDFFKQAAPSDVAQKFIGVHKGLEFISGHSQMADAYRSIPRALSTQIKKLRDDEEKVKDAVRPRYADEQLGAATISLLGNIRDTAASAKLMNDYMNENLLMVAYASGAFVEAAKGPVQKMNLFAAQIDKANSAHPPKSPKALRMQAEKIKAAAEIADKESKAFIEHIEKLNPSWELRAQDFAGRAGEVINGTGDSELFREMLRNRFANVLNAYVNANQTVNDLGWELIDANIHVSAREGIAAAKQRTKEAHGFKAAFHANYAAREMESTYKVITKEMTKKYVQAYELISDFDRALDGIGAEQDQEKRRGKLGRQLQKTSDKIDRFVEEFPDTGKHVAWLMGRLGKHTPLTRDWREEEGAESN